MIENELVGFMTNSMDRSLSKLQEIVNNRKAWCSTALGITKSWIYLVTKQQQISKVILSKIHLINDYITFFNIDLVVYGAFQSCTCGNELKMHIILKYEQIAATF